MEDSLERVELALEALLQVDPGPQPGTSSTISRQYEEEDKEAGKEEEEGSTVYDEHHHDALSHNPGGEGPATRQVLVKSQGERVYLLRSKRRSAVRAMLEQRQKNHHRRKQVRQESKSKKPTSTSDAPQPSSSQQDRRDFTRAWRDRKELIEPSSIDKIALLRPGCNYMVEQSLYHNVLMPSQPHDQHHHHHKRRKHRSHSPRVDNQQPSTSSSPPRPHGNIEKDDKEKKGVGVGTATGTEVAPPKAEVCTQTLREEEVTVVPSISEGIQIDVQQDQGEKKESPTKAMVASSPPLPPPSSPPPLPPPLEPEPVSPPPSQATPPPPSVPEVVFLSSLPTPSSGRPPLPPSVTAPVLGPLPLQGRVHVTLPESHQTINDLTDTDKHRFRGGRSSGLWAVVEDYETLAEQGGPIVLLELRDPNDPTTRPMEREYLLVRDISHPLTSLPSPGLDKEDRQDTGHHHSDGQDFKNGRARANEEEEEEEKLREERLRRSLGPLTTGLASLGEELRRLEDQAQDLEGEMERSRIKFEDVQKQAVGYMESLAEEMAPYKNRRQAWDDPHGATTTDSGIFFAPNGPAGGLRQKEPSVPSYPKTPPPPPSSSPSRREARSLVGPRYLSQAEEELFQAKMLMTEIEEEIAKITRRGSEAAIGAVVTTPTPKKSDLVSLAASTTTIRSRTTALRNTPRQNTGRLRMAPNGSFYRVGTNIKPRWKG